jgi:hypothetical protein
MAFGSPVYIGQTSSVLNDYIKGIHSFDGKKIILFTTGGADDSAQLDAMEKLLKDADAPMKIGFMSKETEKNKAEAYTESNLGGFLDLAADAFFIFSSFITLNLFNIVPSWYTLFIFFKFIEFIITSSLWKKFNNESKEYYMKDTPGRLAAALFYITPGIVYLLFYMRCSSPIAILIPYACITAILSLYSSFMRCSKILSALKKSFF